MVEGSLPAGAVSGSAEAVVTAAAEAGSGFWSETAPAAGSLAGGLGVLDGSDCDGSDSVLLGSA